MSTCRGCRRRQLYACVQFTQRTAVDVKKTEVTSQWHVRFAKIINTVGHRAEVLAITWRRSTPPFARSSSPSSVFRTSPSLSLAFPRSRHASVLSRCNLSPTRPRCFSTQRPAFIRSFVLSAVDVVDVPCGTRTDRRRQTDRSISAHPKYTALTLALLPIACRAPPMASRARCRTDPILARDIGAVDRGLRR